MLGVELLIAEWDRIIMLGNCLLKNRHGKTITKGDKQDLKDLQNLISLVRTKEPWLSLIRNFDLDLMEQDILILVIASEAEPQIGWMYQDLQPGVSGNFPTPALIRELLFIDKLVLNDFYEYLSPSSSLVRSGLIEKASSDSFTSLRPSKQAISQLLGLKLVKTQPPTGTIDITSSANWDDLVLPEYCISALKEFLNWIEHRDTVIDKWGGRSTGGPVALFAGPSGTGKTFTANVIATALGWPLYRVDLGVLVSKYIGETEKNLNALFDAANDRPMVLLFDEAESIFGKRADIKDARDRYANMEVSHLLSRIEYHNGPCILTTNLRKHLDSAFARRFQLVLDFPLPDINARKLLWQKHLPPRAPLSSDVDTTLLGESVTLTGGQIKNAALHAAFLSAADAKPINLNSLARAVWTEMNKEGREVMLSNLGLLSNHLNQRDNRVKH